MRRRIKAIRKFFKEDYQRSTTLTSAMSTLTDTAFTLFNGTLGIIYRSLWHGAICVYYLLLAVIRAVIVNAEGKELLTKQSLEEERRKKICVNTHLLLLLMDISLIVPIAVMVRGERSYTYGLIPAIAMAAYTTYRITMSVIHFRKSRKNDNLLVSELRMINFTDSLLALLTLQNALITANGGMKGNMKTLSSWTSGGIYAFIVSITIHSFLKARSKR